MARALVAGQTGVLLNNVRCTLERVAYHHLHIGLAGRTFPVGKRAIHAIQRNNKAVEKCYRAARELGCQQHDRNLPHFKQGLMG